MIDTMNERRHPRDADELAIERYRYLLRTAPPDRIEAAHAEAFAGLTPDQRRNVLEGLAREVPESELQGVDTDPDRLARAATRAEMRQPGTLDRAFGDMRTGPLAGFGFGGSFLSMLAGAFIGTSIANMLFADHGYPEGDPAADEASASDADATEEPGGWSGSEGGGLEDEGGFGGDDLGGDFGGDVGGDGGFEI